MAVSHVDSGGVGSTTAGNPPFNSGSVGSASGSGSGARSPTFNVGCAVSVPETLGPDVGFARPAAVDQRKANEVSLEQKPPTDHAWEAPPSLLVPEPPPTPAPPSPPKTAVVQTVIKPVLRWKRYC